MRLESDSCERTGIDQDSGDRDQAAILGLVRSNNVRSLLVASDNYEDSSRQDEGPGVASTLFRRDSEGFAARAAQQLRPYGAW
jgi:hypothetical protein